MPIRLGIATLVLLLGLTASPAAQGSPLGYAVDLNDRADDRFKVTAWVSGLGPANAVYQFAATAPGTYQVMDIGRFVRSFEAFDLAGRPLPVERVSVNQWRLGQPARVRMLRYSIAETWDTPVERDEVYLMCGTSMEQDHVLINPHAVIGYPTGMQARPIRLRLTYPTNWKVGTALERDPSGAYLAEDFDHLVDSPILLGRLTEARTQVTGVPVEIFTYSRTGKIASSQLLDAMDEMLQAAGRFLGKLPVDRYTFLYHFGEQSAGAWEHSLSSEYVLQESEFTDSLGERITDIAAHEFFHVVTPLNLHSEIIEHFNFVTPVPSQHLWLYEGVTEWASHAMQLRSGLKSLDDYLEEIALKLRLDQANFDSAYSLRDLALTSYSDSGHAQYANIYMRGAVTADLLDIRLLELSDGKQGLQDLILELARRYGKERAFPESSFVDTLVAMTHPEIRDFFDRYVWESERLPVAEYYGKLGIRLVEGPDGLPVRFEVDSAPAPAQRALREAWLGRKPRPASRPGGPRKSGVFYPKVPDRGEPPMLTRFFPIPFALALALPGSAPLAAQNAAASALAACDSDALCGRVPRPVGLYIRAVEEDGRYLALEDGSLWEVEISDRATTAAWAPDDFVNLSLIAAPREDFEYLLTRAGTLDQKAAVRLAGRRPGPAGQEPVVEDPALEEPTPDYRAPEYPDTGDPAPEDPAGQE